METFAIVVIICLVAILHYLLFVLICEYTVGALSRRGILASVFFQPSALSDTKYDKEWDAKCKTFLESGNKFTRFQYDSGGYCEHTVWIRNWPYSSLNPYNKGKDSIRPSKITMYRMAKRILKDQSTLRGHHDKIL